MDSRLVVILSLCSGNHQLVMRVANGFGRCALEIDHGEEAATCLGKIAAESRKDTETLPTPAGQLRQCVIGTKTLDLAVVSGRCRELTEMPGKTRLTGND